jgi:hypothetical protein
MSMDTLAWVVTDGQGRFLADGPRWVEDAAQARVFHELWAASGQPGIVLPWATAMQVGAHLADASA